MSISRLRDLLIKHEGLKLFPYRCSEGRLSIGIGRNLEDVGLSELEARFLLSNDIERVMKEATWAFAWFNGLTVPRQDVILSLVFNMGLSRFKTFKKMISAIVRSDYGAAADELLNSKYATQVGIRAIELAAMMRSGVYKP